MAEEEQARWGALPRLEVLDTPPDARFDRIVRLAQSIGGTPIAAISLFDRDRLWMQSHVGLVTDELLRKGSFGDAATHSDGLYLAEDTLLDPALRDLPMVGDEVLVEVGARVRGALRAGDVAGRIGGDEFAVILDSVRDETEAAAVAERILANVAGVAHLTEGSVRIGVSVGVSLNSAGDTADRLLRRADSALLEAKRAGKNQVRMSPGAPSVGSTPTM